MKRAFGTVVTLLVVNVGIVLLTATGTPYAASLGRALAQFLGLGVLAAGVGWGITRVVAGRGERGARPQGNSQRSTSRIAAIAVATILLQAVVIFGLGLLGRVPAEAAYYIVLFGSGVAVALWGRGGPAVPIWLSTGLLLVPSIIGAALFAADPGNRWQYGPEVYLFTLWGYAGRMSTLPLDVATAWSGWALASASERRLDK